MLVVTLMKLWDSCFKVLIVSLTLFDGVGEEVFGWLGIDPECLDEIGWDFLPGGRL